MALVCYIWGVKKFEKVFRNVKEAAQSLSCNRVDDVISNLGIEDEMYNQYAQSDSFKITIEPTGIMRDTDGYPTNEVKLILSWE